MFTQLIKLGWRFGKGSYFLPQINDKDQKPHYCSELSEKRKKKYLSHPVGDTSYLIKAILFRTSFEFDDYYEVLIKQRDNILGSNFLCSVPVDSLDQDSGTDYIIDLKKLVNFSQEEEDEEDKPHQDQIVPINYWVKLTVDKQIVACAFIEGNDSVSIFTDQPIILTGWLFEKSLKIFSTDHVEIDNNLMIKEKLEIHAASLFDPKEEISVHAKQITFYVEQQCILHGKYIAEEIIIKSGELDLKGVLETDINTTLITESFHQNGALYAKEKSIDIVCMEYKSSESSRLHCPQAINIMALNYVQKGVITSNRFTLQNLNTQIYGEIYVAFETSLQTIRCLYIDEKAIFVLNGQATMSSAWAAEFRGRLLYSPNLEVRWKELVNPINFLESKELIGPSLFLPDLTRPSHEWILHSSDHSLICPKQKILTSEIKEIPLHKKPGVILSAELYLSLPGAIAAFDTDLALISNRCLDFSGKIWQKSLLDKKDHLVYFKSEEMHWSKEAMVEAKQLQTVISGDFSIAGNINTTGSTSIKAENLLIETGAKIKSDKVLIRTSGDFTTREKSDIDCQQTAIQCHNFYHYGNLVSKELAFFEAERFIYKRGPVVAKKQHYTASYFESIGTLEADELSVTSYASLILGFNRCKNFSDYSLISFTPLLTLQMLVCPPNPLTFALTVLNVGFTVLNAFVPAAIKITLPIQFAINSLARLSSNYKQILQLKNQLLQYSDSSSSIDTLRIITTTNQLVVSLASTVLAAIGFSHNLNLNVTSTPELLPLLERVGTNLLPMFSGYNNFSLISINPEIFIGFGKTNFNLISFDLGGILGISHYSNSLFAFDGSFNGMLTPSSCNHLFLYEGGNTWGLYDSCYLTATEARFSPFFGQFPYEHWNIQADSFSSDKSAIFEQSQFNTKDFTITPYSTLQLQQSTLQTSEIENHGTLLFINSSANLDHLNNLGVLQFIISSAFIKYLENHHATLICDAAQLKSQKIWVDDFSKFQTRCSALIIEKLTSSGQVSLRNSQLHGDVTISGDFWAKESVLTGRSFTGHGKHKVVDSAFDYKKLHFFVKQTRGTVIIHDDRYYPTSHYPTSRKQFQLFVEHLPQFSVAYDNGIVYKTAGNLLFRGETLETAVPIFYLAATIETQGSLIVTNHFFLEASQGLKIIKATIQGSASATFVGNNIVIQESQILASGNLLFNTPGTFYNQASALRTPGILSIGSAADITVLAKVVTHTTHHSRWVWHGLHSGVQTITDVTTEIIPALLSAKTILLSTKGQIKIEGTDLVTDSIMLQAQGPITILDIHGKNSHCVRNFSLLGYSHVKLMDEISEPARLLSRDNIHIASQNEVMVRGTILHAPAIDIQGTKITFTRCVLNHSLERAQLGLTLSLPIKDFNFMASIPMLAAINQLFSANNSVTTINSLTNLLISGTNSLNKMSQYARTGASSGKILTGLLARDLCMRLLSIEAQFGFSHLKQSSQTLGMGEIEADKLNIVATKDLNFDNTFDIRAEHCQLSAENITIDGAHLRFASKVSQLSLASGIGLCGLSPLSVQFNESLAIQLHHVVSQIYIKDLNITAHQLFLRSTDLTTDEMTGQIDFLHVHSELDVTRSYSHGFHTGLDGSLQLMSGDAKYSILPHQTKLKVLSEKTQINYVDLIDATAEGIEAKEFKVSKQTPLASNHHFTLGGNLYELIRTKPLTSALPEDVFYAFNISINQIALTLPILNPAGLQQLRENIHWLKTQMTPPSPPKEVRISEHKREISLIPATGKLVPETTSTELQVLSTIQNKELTLPVSSGSFLDILSALNPITSAYAEDPKSSFNEEGNVNFDFNADDLTILGGFSTLGAMIAYSDTQLLEQALKNFVPLPVTEFSNYYKIYNISHKLLMDEYMALSYLSARSFCMNSSFISHSIFQDIYEQNTRSISTDRTQSIEKNWDVFKEKIDGTLFSDRGLNLYRNTSYLLTGLSALSVTYDLYTATDKISALRQEGAAYLGAGDGLALGEMLWARFLGVSLWADEPSLYIKIPALLVASLMGSYGGIEVDQQMNGNEIPAILGMQALSHYKDYRAYARYYPEYVKLYESGTTFPFSTFENALMNVGPENSLGISNLMALRFSQQLNDYYTIIKNTAAEASIVGKHHLQKQCLFNPGEIGLRVFDNPITTDERTLLFEMLFENVPGMTQPLLRLDYSAAWQAFDTAVRTETDFSLGYIKKLQFLSPALGAISIGLAGYEIATSPNKTWETMHQLSLFSGGAAGGYLGGLAASSMCGFAAPLCAGAFTLTGAAVGTLGAESIFSKFSLPAKSAHRSESSSHVPLSQHTADDRMPLYEVRTSDGHANTDSARVSSAINVMTIRGFGAGFSPALTSKKDIVFDPSSKQIEFHRRLMIS